MNRWQSPESPLRRRLILGAALVAPALVALASAVILLAALVGRDRLFFAAPADPADLPSLMSAVGSGDLARAHELLLAGVDPNGLVPFQHYDITGDRELMASALYRSAGFGDDNMALLLLHNGADIRAESNRHAICAAAALGRTSVLPVLLRFGADPNPKPKCEDGQHSPLRAALDNGHQDAAAYLRENNALLDY